MRNLLISILICSLAFSSLASTIKSSQLDNSLKFYVQAGAFSKENNAKKLSIKLAEQLHQPTLIENKKALYLVKLGPFPTQELANKIKQLIDNEQTIETKPQHLDVKKDSISQKPPSTDERKVLSTAINAPAAPIKTIKMAEKSSRAKTKQPNQQLTSILNKLPHLQNTTQTKVHLPTKKAKTDDSDGQVALTTAIQLAKNESQPLSNTPKINKNYQPKIKPQTRLWNLRNADIRSVIAEVSRETNKNFVIDPRVQGKISIISSTPMSPKEIYPVFLSMLQVSGYAAIAYGDVTKIVPNIDAKTQASDLLSRMRSPAKGDEMVVEVVAVKYVPAEQLVPVLRPLMPQWSNVSAYGPSNMLILSGRANNIKRLADIISQVDSSAANGIDIAPLKYALSMDVAQTLKNLLKATGPSPSSSRTKATIAADTRSNSILISGSKTERIRIRLLIEKLDSRSPNGLNGNTQVIYLHYQRAEDLVPILAGIAKANFSGVVGTTIGTTTRPPLDTSSPVASSSSATQDTSSQMSSLSQSGSSSGSAALNQQSTPTTQSSSSQSEAESKPKVELIAEPNTNSIIISGPQTLIRTLKSITHQLDIKPAQLVIEAIIAEINENDVNTLGIQWGSITTGEDGTTSSFTPGLAIINSTTSINDFEARITALANDRRANILSTPSVVVLDNRQAKILVGKNVAVQTTGQITNTTGAPFQTFERKNVALHLYVRPQITRDNGIQMQIDQGNDTLDPPNTTDPGPNPVFNISSITTSVHIQSGDIIVLGGLNQDGLANQDRKIPILGDIPGIGRLFQNNTTIRDKRLLMVFIRPIIISRIDDALSVTGSKYDDIRDLQLEFIRNQEVYNKNNDRTIVKSLTDRVLPQPFSRRAKGPVLMK
jgi:general secretion pathway protein D